MDLDDIATRYQEIPRWKRYMTIVLVAMLPAAYEFWDRYQGLVDAQNAAITELANEVVKLKEFQAKHEALKKLDEKLAQAELEVKAASKVLPDEILMDKVLENTELIAQNVGISMKTFEPKSEIPSETAFKYLKVPIHLELVGTYGQIASFLDHVVHSETTTFVENISIAVNDAKSSSSEEKLVLNEKMEERKRAKMRLRASFDMVLFRTMTEAEAAAVQSVYEEKRKAEKQANPTPPELNSTTPAPTSSPENVPAPVSAPTTGHKPQSLHWGKRVIREKGAKTVSL